MAEKARQEMINKRHDYDGYLAHERATDFRSQTPNKDHLHEMGLLFEPQNEEWYKESHRQEKLKKRRDYEKYLVSFEIDLFNSLSRICSCIENHKISHFTAF